MNEINLYVMRDDTSKLCGEPFTADNHFTAQVATFEALCSSRVQRPFTLLCVGVFDPESGAVTGSPVIVDVCELQPPYNSDTFARFLDSLRIEKDFLEKF